MTRAQKAAEIYKQDYTCSQAVLVVFADDFDLDRDTALRIACGMGGGMGRTDQMCGAVTGAIMVLGLRYGMTDPARQEDKLDTYGKVKQFMERFIQCHESVGCTDLIGCNLSTPEGLERSQTENLADTICPPLVEDAVRILEEMLQE
jgi:C_GCAxxG_C_C family probable redox protein